ncbi:LLM class flavin-dependent oxidoreductase [Amycolatopsis sp. lyj-23]|uniref:LLM class flavin-dependent oxidoreductase n=1 Tax=Amycolatopsis sp. lyj-23 TaxID=2789283 RepID=UPI003977E8AF
MRISILDQSPITVDMAPADALHNTVDLARHADRLGYHRYWIAEHHSMASHASSAPEILVARVAAETTGIRVGSGGVLLSNHSAFKVAETFSILEGLYPGRIDLGIGRSFGAGSLEAIALSSQRSGSPTVEDFPEKLAELLAFLHGDFPPGHPFATIDLTPRVPEAPPVWLLGSSPSSAAFTAANGLPYSYAHFINPAGTRDAVRAYLEHFEPSRHTPEPRVILGIGVYCGDTEEEAQYVYASQRLFRRRLTRNIIGPVPSPEQALEELKTGGDPLAEERFEWPRYVVGTPEQVRERITEITSALGVDEIVVLATIYDHKARVRSYELLAEAFELTPR